LRTQNFRLFQEIYFTRIERTEESRSLFEDADFSVETIKKSIMQGERDAEKALVKNK